MKILIMSMGILALIAIFGIPSLVDDYMLSWLASLWDARMQKAVTILIGLSIIAYASVYIIYAYRHRDKPASR